MAKVKVIFGKLRGKIGGNVFRSGDNGETIVSEYNGNPRNPRTMLQVRQRNKMNLVGKVSAVTPYAAIAALGSNRRVARSAYVSQLLKLAIDEVDPSSPNEVTTKVNFVDVVLSRGVEVSTTGTVTMDDVTATLTVTMDAYQGEIPLLGVKLVCYASQGERFIGVMTKDVQLSPTQTTVVTFKIANSGAELSEGGGGCIIAIPIVDVGGDASATYDTFVEMGNPTAQINAARKLAAAKAYGHSRYVGQAYLG